MTQDEGGAILLIQKLTKQVGGIYHEVRRKKGTGRYAQVTIKYTTTTEKQKMEVS